LGAEWFEVADVVGDQHPAGGESGFEDHRVVLGGEDDVFGDRDAVDASGSELFGEAGGEHLIE
jgi:hypothetical protein